MFGSIALEVLIGLVLVYLLLSLVCSTIQEGLASRLNWRGWMLCDAIARLFDEPLPEKTVTKRGPWTQSLYTHPLIDALHRGQDRPPSYIPNAVFADALIDRLATPAGPGATAPLAPTDRWLAVLRALDLQRAAPGALNAKTGEALRMLAGRVRQRIDGSAPDAAAQALAAFKDEVDGWYQNTMDRTSGWYKRKSQRAQFWIAALAVLATNADTVMISEQLATDPKAREAAAKAAADFVAKHPELRASDDAGAGAQASNNDAKADIRSIRDQVALLQTQTSEAQIEIGWPDPVRERARAQRDAAAVLLRTDAKEAEKASAQATLDRVHPGTKKEELGALRAQATSTLRWWWLRKVVGLLVTMCAVALGAPFWFQMLDKLVKLRGSGERITSSDASASVPGAPPSDTPPATSPVSGVAVAAKGAAGVTSVTIAAAAPSAAAAALDKLDDRYWANVAERWKAAKRTGLSAQPKDAEVAVFLARMAALAYEAKWTIQARVSALGVNAEDPNEFQFFDDHGTQAFAFKLGGDVIAAYRGTEPTKLDDVMADADVALKTNAPYSGRVHTGFAQAIDRVFDAVDKWIDAALPQGGRVFLTGHSLGAALATLHFDRRTGDKKRDAKQHQLVTFGSPRVGDPVFWQLFEGRLGFAKDGDVRSTRVLRFINNRDVVTRVAPRSMNFKHVGAECYIDADGRVHLDGKGTAAWNDFVLLVLDGLAEFKAALKKPVGDHSMDLYVRRLENWTNWSA